MNITGSVPHTGGGLQYTQLLSAELYLYLRVVLWSLILTIGLHATILNIINIAAFYTVGLADSISVCFFSLSLADMVSMTAMIYFSSSTLYSIITDAAPWVFPCNYIAFRLVYISTDISAAVTTYIALQRGLCVALPFFTRQFFTKERSIGVVITFAAFFLACTLPAISSTRLYFEWDAERNATIIKLRFTPTFKSANAFVNSFIKIGLSFAEQILMALCLIAIARGMVSSQKLKLLTSPGSIPSSHNIVVSPENDATIKDATLKKDKPKQPGNPSDRVNTTLNSTPSRGDGAETEEGERRRRRRLKKEARAVKQSLLVVVIHMACVTPRIAMSLLALTAPRFTIRGHNSNLFDTVYLALNLNDCINALVNFFVYFRFNAAFKKTVIAFTRRKRISS